MYKTYLPKDLFSFWSNPLKSIFTKSSVLDNTPSQDVLKLIQNDRPFNRKISFHSVDVQTGQLIVFDETIPADDIALLIKSSASIPFIFEAPQFEHMFLIDGGTAINIALADPIIRCLDEEGVAPEDIIVDVIIC